MDPQMDTFLLEIFNLSSPYQEWAKCEPNETSEPSEQCEPRVSQVSQGRSKWAKGDPRVNQVSQEWAKSVKSAKSAE